MSFKPEEITSLIKEQLKTFNLKTEIKEQGKVISLGDGIALVYGLTSAMMGELIKFPNNNFGIVFNLEEFLVGVVLLGSEESVKEGDIVTRTSDIVQVGVGDQFLGRVINSLGQPIDGLGDIKSKKFRQIERVAPGVMTRESVKDTLETGILFIDSMIPIGKGQRELIIGDRQTGKTSIAVDIIINQKGKDVYCIYVAIAQKNSTVTQIVKKLKEHDAMDYTVVLSSTASDSTSMQYLAPYTGITIAEEWMENGKDVIIIFDDLSKHAVAYRSLSLLLRRPPGREAYPGDVFYLHSRLLERSAKLNKEYGGGSITALPIIETQAGDISAYIPTNVISITDGQIFLMMDLFNSGQRPAISSGLSVSRVGSAAQNKAMKFVASSLKLELAQYFELQAFTQFGSDVDASTQVILEHGQKILKILKQQLYTPYSQTDQAILLLTLKEKFISWVNIDDVEDYKHKLLDYVHNHYQNIHQKLTKEAEFTPEILLGTKKAILDHLNTYLKLIHNYPQTKLDQFSNFYNQFYQDNNLVKPSSNSTSKK
ncbi:F0F1 ATP synthase subunit alpha [Mycoplasma sp. SG1]|uniref:F0F1 ATP synthase subunit alpha n=1 Tax=Mycoplasma sp. SG1 TaxID=2810348 RepID=UPI0020258C40|nr:F0F1 ATP synthase subunit alpha [Mycoplasma sp. SG1]URM52972.1 F0F1 ATP synthase subunit alpha [Mycoplasma sp. SG1]